MAGIVSAGDHSLPISDKCFLDGNNKSLKIESHKYEQGD
jgi:hypothetical protein